MIRGLVLMGLVGCVDQEEFALEFVAVHHGARVGCDDVLMGFGPDADQSVRIADLRLYVSALEFLDADGLVIAHTLDANEFQLDHPEGWVSLVDLAGTDAGACAPDGITFAEGTARLHPTLTGQTAVDDVASVRFDVGVPQAVMSAVIGDYTAEAAPSPLGEMYWSWVTGYRHFVLNMAVDAPEEQGEGYVHIGSTDCAAKGENALESRSACGAINTPRVAMEFDLVTDVIGIDVGTLLAGLDFRAPVYDPQTFEIIGEQPGVECHSSTLQSDCAQIFDAVGIDPDGDAAADANQVFRRL